MGGRPSTHRHRLDSVLNDQEKDAWDICYKLAVEEDNPTQNASFRSWGHEYSQYDFQRFCLLRCLFGNDVAGVIVKLLVYLFWLPPVDRCPKLVISWLSRLNFHHSSGIYFEIGDTMYYCDNRSNPPIFQHPCDTTASAGFQRLHVRSVVQTANGNKHMLILFSGEQAGLYANGRNDKGQVRQELATCSILVRLGR